MAVTKTTPATLDAASLAALETIEIGATALAALETIELGATTLAALETITADTELPVAAALGDADANPTAPAVGAHLMIWSGATWRRVSMVSAYSDATGMNGAVPVGAWVYNNAASSWDRMRSASQDGAGVGGMAGAAEMLFNGTGYDRSRGNIEATALASAARTSTTNSADLTNYNGAIVHVQINVTVWTADNLTPSIQAKDALSGTYYTLLTGAAITGTGFTCLKIGPGITAAANVSAADLLPRTWRVVMTHAGATTTTYSVGYSLGAS